MSMPVCELSDLPRLMCGCAEHRDWIFDFDDLTPAEHAFFNASPQATQRVRTSKVVPIEPYRAEPWGSRSNVDVAARGDACRVCESRPAGDAFVCAECMDDVQVALGDVPALLDDLELVANREANQRTRRHERERAEHTRWDNVLSADSSGVAPGRMLASKGFNQTPYAPAATNLVAALGNELTTMVRALCDSRGLEVPRVDATGASRWLLSNASTIAIDVHGPDFATALLKFHKRGMVLIDNEPEGRPLGPCDNPACGVAMYAEFGAKVHVCERCGQQYDVEERLEARRSKIRESLLSLGEIARFSDQDAKTFGDRVTIKQLEGWSRRGRLMRAGSKPGGPQGETALYRAGDVLDLVEARRAS